MKRCSSWLWRRASHSLRTVSFLIMNSIKNTDEDIKKCLDELFQSFRFDPLQESWEEAIKRFHKNIRKRCRSEYNKMESHWNSKVVYFVALHCLYHFEDNLFKIFLEEQLILQSGICLVICYLLNKKSSKYLNVLGYENNPWDDEKKDGRRKVLLDAILSQFVVYCNLKNKSVLKFLARCLSHLGDKERHLQLVKDKRIEHNFPEVQMPEYEDYPSEDGAELYVPRLNMNLPLNRLSTMTILPDSFRYTGLKQFAENGFYYAGRDNLLCCDCGISFSIPKAPWKIQYEKKLHEEKCVYKKSVNSIHRMNQEVDSLVINANPEQYREMFVSLRNNPLFKNWFKVCCALAKVCQCIAPALNKKVLKIYADVYKTCSKSTFSQKNVLYIKRFLLQKEEKRGFDEFEIPKLLPESELMKLEGLKPWIEAIQGLSRVKKYTPTMLKILTLTDPMKWLKNDDEAAWEITKPFMSKDFKIEGNCASSFDIGQLIQIIPNIRPLNSTVSNWDNIWNMRDLRNSMSHNQYKIDDDTLEDHRKIMMLFLNDNNEMGAKKSGLYHTIKEVERDSSEIIDALIQEVYDLKAADVSVFVQVSTSASRILNVAQLPLPKVAIYGMLGLKPEEES